MKKIVLISLMLLFVTLSFAHDDNVSHYVNMENPASLVNPDGFFEYMIVKGDYLWMLADRFYSDPYKWREIHGGNPYIVDPNWIYPNNWLVIPNVFSDSDGKPVYGLPPTVAIVSNEPTQLVAYDSEGNVIIDDSGKAVAIAGYGVDSDGDGVIDGYDTDGDGQIDITAGDALTLDEHNAAKTEADAKAKAAEAKAAEEEARAAAATLATQEKKARKSYCSKPGWKLGLHAGYPVGGGPEDENLNLGLLLGTPLGVKVGPLSLGLGAGAFTYDFNKFYLGGGLLASLCINELLQLDMPVILQLHGAGFYIFGEEQGLGVGAIGSANAPLGNTPLSLGLYGALGKYYPGDKDYTWSNVGVVLFYSL